MFDNGFKFKMYDIVTTVVKSSVTMMIVGRVFEECPGGIQRHYNVRLFFIHKEYTRSEPEINPAMKLNTYNECELRLPE